MSWHYLPVWVPGYDDDERVYSLCEVYLDKAGRLEHWTVEAELAPVGNDIADLSGAVTRMQYDIVRWKPVKFSDLKVGMELERNG